MKLEHTGSPDPFVMAMRIDEGTKLKWWPKIGFQRFVGLQASFAEPKYSVFKIYFKTHFIKHFLSPLRIIHCCIIFYYCFSEANLIFSES